MKPEPAARAPAIASRISSAVVVPAKKGLPALSNQYHLRLASSLVGAGPRPKLNASLCATPMVSDGVYRTYARTHDDVSSAP